MIGEADSTNLVPPWLGRGLPLYPKLDQLVRVYAPALVGLNAYPCYVQQMVSPLVLRDREPAYLLEPNGILLGPGYYNARLESSYGGLPLYVAHCCSGGSFSSSSSSSSHS